MRAIYIFLILLATSFGSVAQVGIGTTTPRAALEISNDANAGLLIPQFALTGNNDATTVVNPETGALIVSTLVYNTTAVTGANALPAGFTYWNGTIWIPLAPSAGSGWLTTGNTGTDGGITNFLGTTDARSLQFRTNNQERVRIGNFAVGSALTNVSSNTTFTNTSVGSLTNYSAETTLGIPGQNGQAVAVNGDLTGVRINQTLNNSSSVSGNFVGVNNRMWGINSGGSLNTVEGFRNDYQFEGTSVRPSNVNAFRSSLVGSAGTLITNFRGLYTSFTNNIPVTTFEGVRLDGAPAAVLNYFGIYQDNLGTDNRRYFLYYNGDNTATQKMVVTGLGRLGLGTDVPTATAHIVGGLRYVDGNINLLNKVLTSDANGNATWQTPSGGGGGASWLLAGNNITGNANFLGSTNFESVYFRANNTQIGRLHPGGGVGFGFNSNATANNSIAIGNTSTANQNAVALGNSSNALGNEAIAIGSETRSSFQNFAIGLRATASGNNSIAFGSDAVTRSQNSIAIGTSATTASNNNIAIGNSSFASVDNAIAIGTSSRATSNENIAVGNSSEASAFRSSAFGNNARSTNQNSSAIGNAAITTKDNQIVLGSTSNTEVRSFGNLVVGSNDLVNYQLPNSRGNTGQVLKINNVGIVTWQNDLTASPRPENAATTQDLENLRDLIREQQAQIDELKQALEQIRASNRN